MILVSRTKGPVRRWSHPGFARRLSSLAAAACIGAIAPTPAAADLVVAPLRAVLDVAEEETIFVVSNPGDRIMDVRAEWLDLTIGPGGYTNAEPGIRRGLSAAPYLVVEPSRLRLGPGARGEVRVRLRAGAPEGEERRSHLLFSANPSRSPLRRTGGGLRADIGLGVSTPVIVRNEIDLAKVAASFESVRLDRDSAGALLLIVRIARTGPASTFGELRADFKPEGVRNPKPLASLGNVAVAIETKTHEFSLPLGVDALPAGSLRISYVGTGEFAGRALAARTFNIAAPASDRGSSERGRHD